jgi:hypothetical protein
VRPVLGACAVAFAVAAGGARAGVLHTGACTLALDPQSDAGEAELGFNLCLQGEAGGEVEFASGAPKTDGWLEFGHAAAGVYATPWISVQSRAVYRRLTAFAADGPSLRDVYPDYAILQIGNPALDKWRLTGGRTRLPVGIDQSLAPEMYQLLENRRLWQSPPYGAYLTFDDLRAFRVDLGYGTNELNGKREADYPQTEPAPGSTLIPVQHAASLRASYDLSALEGTRVLASAYAEKGGERHFGAGIINRNSHDDLTEFEFIRRLTTPDGRLAPFEQLLRLLYASAWHSDRRWVVEVDDERFRFRRGILDSDFKAWDHLILRLGAGYYKSEAGDDVRRWSFLTGLEAQL